MTTAIKYIRQGGGLHAGSLAGWEVPDEDDGKLMAELNDLGPLDQEKHMADETKRIEALYGPYRGQHLDLPAADADQAIKDGWARDPYAEPSAEVQALDPEKQEKATAAAEKAARKLRGEDEPPAAEPAAEEKTEQSAKTKK